MSKLYMLITSLECGGAERVVSELSRNFSDRIESQIVLLSNKINYPVNKQPISLDIKIRNGNYYDIFYSIIFGTFRYRKILRAEKSPLCSISFLTLDNFINILSGIGNKDVRVIISVHIALSMKFRSSLSGLISKLLIKILYRRADQILAVSYGVKDELINDLKLNEDNISVIYNPVDIKSIVKLSEEKITDEIWFSEEIPVLINVGRLTKQKGQWHLIRAFKAVREKMECRLIIRGDGELRSYLEKMIEDLCLEKDIKIIDWKENHYKYISMSRLFISTSLWEALPYVLIEAMACGCPVIATDCKYGPREILSNGDCGKLVPPLDGKFYNPMDPLTIEEKLLAEEILCLLNDAELRDSLRRKARLKAEQFDLRTTINEYEKLIRA